MLIRGCSVFVTHAKVGRNNPFTVHVLASFKDFLLTAPIGVRPIYRPSVLIKRLCDVSEIIL